MKGWPRFWEVQLVMLLVAAVGLVPIAVACALKAWVPAVSTEWAPDATVKAHCVYAWRWTWMNRLWGNPEDGVTGTAAFNPNTTRWMAFVWSALRNYSDNLKYVYAEPGGVWYYKQITRLNHIIIIMAGYRNAAGLPTCSIGATNVS